MKRLGIVAVGLALLGTLLALGGSPVRAQPVASIALPPPRGTVQLYLGCNNIALSFPDGTDSQAVVQAVTPAGVIQAMWRHNAAENRFEGFSPAAPQASDLLTVKLWDAVWLCVGGVMPPLPTATPSTPAAVGESCACSIDQVTVFLNTLSPLINEGTDLLERAMLILRTGGSYSSVIEDMVALKDRVLAVDTPPCATVVRDKFAAALGEMIAGWTDTATGQFSSASDHLNNAAAISYEVSSEIERMTQEAQSCAAPTAPTEVPSAPPTPLPVPTSTGCCKICTTGKACGDSCISRSYTCHQPPGCACNAY
jgi:hypothetical protein